MPWKPLPSAGCVKTTYAKCWSKCPCHNWGHCVFLGVPNASDVFLSYNLRIKEPEFAAQKTVVCYSSACLHASSEHLRKGITFFLFSLSRSGILLPMATFRHSLHGFQQLFCFLLCVRHSWDQGGQLHSLQSWTLLRPSSSTNAQTAKPHALGVLTRGRSL